MSTFSPEPVVRWTPIIKLWWAFWFRLWVPLTWPLVALVRAETTEELGHAILFFLGVSAVCGPVVLRWVLALPYGDLVVGVTQYDRMTWPRSLPGTRTLLPWRDTAAVALSFGDHTLEWMGGGFLLLAVLGLPLFDIVIGVGLGRWVFGVPTGTLMFRWFLLTLPLSLGAMRGLFLWPIYGGRRLYFHDSAAVAAAAVNGAPADGRPETAGAGAV